MGVCKPHRSRWKAQHHQWRNTNLGAVPLVSRFDFLKKKEILTATRQYEDGLIAYYSDQRDPKHGQKLAHQMSSDLKTWGPVVNDVAYDQYTARPGMTVVAYIPPLKKWILVHELPVGNSSSYGSNYPVYCMLPITSIHIYYLSNQI